MNRPTLKNRRVLITGATGFIGGRIVERLVLEQQAEVVALVHQYAKACRLARFPVRMIGGDITDAERFTEAAEGCDAIVHCAMGVSGSPAEIRRATVEGTRNACTAAKAVGAHLVHLSTFSVYGPTAAGRVDESAPKQPGDDAYGRNKLDAERIVQDFQRQGLSATILQPTVVYGPWSFWSTHAVRQVNSGRVALPEDGSGLCNAVYVDDVAAAIFAAIERRSEAPGPYLITGAEPVTWRAFYEAHASADAAIENLDDETKADILRRTPPLKRAFQYVFNAASRKHIKGLMREVPGVLPTYRAMKKLRHREDSTSDDDSESAPPLMVPYASHLELLESRTHLEWAAAGQALGYEPRVSLEAGGTLTRAWAEWADLAPRSR